MMRHETVWSLLSLLSSTPLRMLYLLVLADRWRLSPHRRRPLLAALVAAVAAIQLICFFVLGTDAQILSAVLGIILSYVIFFVMIPWRQGRALFILLTSISLSSVCSTLVTLLPVSHSAARLSIKLALNLLFIFILYRFFRPGFRKVLEYDTALWYWLSLIPCFFALCFYILRSFQLLHVLPPLLPPLLLLLCALVCCTYMCFLLFFNILNEQYEAGRSDVLRNAQFRQAESEQRDAARVQELYAELTRFQAQLSARLKSGDRAAARALIAGMDAQLTPRHAEPYRFTEEPLLNAVLSYYAAWAQEAGVTLVIRFQLSPHFEAERAGLAVVLSNALENAMHACLELPNERPRRISLEVRSTLRQLFLTITNTCHGPVELDPVTGLPCSRREGHGYGLKSIAAFAAEHGGILQCTTDSNSFCLKLLL